jgi:hypothetical protein
LMTSATHDPYPPQLYDGNISWKLNFANELFGF